MEKIITRRPNGTVRVQSKNTKPSLTQQQFKDQVNVNNIISKYKKTGIITHLRNNHGVFADVANIPDYQEALNKIIKADSAFSMLPGGLRQRFGNDPQKFIQYLSDPKNDQEAIKLGLKIPKTTTQNQNQNDVKEQQPAAKPSEASVKKD